MLRMVSLNADIFFAMVILTAKSVSVLVQLSFDNKEPRGNFLLFRIYKLSRLEVKSYNYTILIYFLIFIF